MCPPILGQGSQQRFFQTEVVNGTDILRLSGSAVLTFPPNAYGLDAVSSLFTHYTLFFSNNYIPNSCVNLTYSQAHTV